MTTNKTRIITIFRYAIPILLTLLWLGFIFSNSLKTGVESGEQSGKVHEIINDVAQSVGIDKPISEKTVRKGAHFTEFAVLALLICLDLLAFGVLSIRKKLYVSSLLTLTAIPVSALFASIDELLQNLSEGRGPQVTDVLIDTSGAVVATLLFLICFVITISVIKKVNATSLQKSLHR